jgi:outer membrane protein assembly factor BamB
MHFDGSDFQFVVGLDKHTGKTVWKCDRSVDFQDLSPDGKVQAEGDWRKGYSTPLVATLAGKPTLLSLGSKALYAYKPDDGTELWRVEERKCHSGSSRPVTDGETIYACMGLPKGELWAIKPGGKGVVTDSHVLWKVTRNVPSKPSTILLDGLIYMIDDGGIASCIEAKTGKEIWRERVGGNYSASPIQAGDRIYFFSEEGKSTVISTGREYKVLGENTLEDGFMSSPAVAGNSLVLRTRTHLYLISE